MDTNAAGAGRPRAPDPEELRLLSDQLARMRGMLFGYSERFFERIRTYLAICLTLLVVSGSGVFPGAVIAVPFLVPFGFLETGYLFYYTVFARRHAEYLERAINARLGHDVLVAHRLEAAYFYEPDAPKIAALSLGRPRGMMSVMTLGYTGGAVLLWLAGMAGVFDLLRTGALDLPSVLELLVPVAAVLWTLAIAAHLVFTFLRREDESRLVAALDASYGAPPQPSDSISGSMSD
jgi:hypothetical protein